MSSSARRVKSAMGLRSVALESTNVRPCRFGRHCSPANVCRPWTSRPSTAASRALSIGASELSINCCRSLASVPVVSEPEWRLIADALDATLRARIADSATAARPITCPLLDTATGACLVYDARPVACRSYGFYAERQYVLGCHRIESIAGGPDGVIWGNHLALEVELAALGPAKPLYDWL